MFSLGMKHSHKKQPFISNRFLTDQLTLSNLSFNL